MAAHLCCWSSTSHFLVTIGFRSSLSFPACTTSSQLSMLFMKLYFLSRKQQRHCSVIQGFGQLMGEKLQQLIADILTNYVARALFVLVRQREELDNQALQRGRCHHLPADHRTFRLDYTKTTKHTLRPHRA